MGYYIRKIAVSGVISTVTFSLFLYFVYNAEGAKNNEKSSVAIIEKKYSLDAVRDINEIVVEMGKQHATQKNTAIVSAQTIQKMQEESTPPSTNRVSQPLASQLTTPPISLPPASITPIVIPTVSALPLTPTYTATPAPIPKQITIPTPAPAKPRTTVS